MQVLFVPPILELLSHGAFFRKLFFYLFRAAAVLAGLIGLVMALSILTMAFRMNATAVLGGGLFSVMTVLAFYTAAHIYWIRAGNIRDLPQSEFTMIPIVSIMLRTSGEVFASVIAVLSVGACLMMWLAGRDAGRMIGEVLPFSPLEMLMREGGNNFLGGLILLIAGFIYALLLLALFYFWAELVVVLAQIALNTAQTAANTTHTSVASTAAAVFAPAHPGPASPRTPAAQESRSDVCAFCGAQNPRGSRFCENCGKPL